MAKKAKHTFYKLKCTDPTAVADACRRTSHTFMLAGDMEYARYFSFMAEDLERGLWRPSDAAHEILLALELSPL